MGRFLRRLRYLFGQSRLEADLREEIEFHRRERQARLEASGLSPDKASVSSRRLMGNDTLAREDARDVWIAPWIDGVVRDVRHGVRLLRRQPGFSLTAIGTLALGVAATTIVFTLVDAEIWKPLPFPRADRLVAAFTTGVGTAAQTDLVSGPDFLAWRGLAQSFEELAAFRGGGGGRPLFRAAGRAESINATRVTFNFFSMLQRPPAIGRTFTATDAAGRPAVLLTDSGWRRLLDANPSALGTTILLDNRPHLVVGILPADLRLEFMQVPDLYVVLDEGDLAAADRKARDYWAVGRLKDGVTRRAADAELRAIAGRLAAEFPDAHEGRGARIDGLREGFTGHNWRSLYFFFGAGVFLLLLSLANVAHLVLARGLTRQREFAVRGALGGAGGVLLRQLVVEGLLLAIPGAAVGLLLTAWIARGLPSWLPPDYLHRGQALALDGRVYAFTAVLSACTAVIFGLAPLVITRRRDLAPVLGHGSRLVTGSRRQRRARHALVVVEVTVALVLLFAAGLFLNSFIRLTQIPLGFAPDDRVTLRLSLSGERYVDGREVQRFTKQLVEEVRAVAGVRIAAAGSSVPLASGQVAWVAHADRPLPAPGEETRTIIRGITPAYFDALGIRRLAGRDFTAADSEGAPRVAVINEQAARRLFPDADPIGKELRVIRASGSWLPPGVVTIVGVVGNIKDIGINEVEFNDLFLPMAQYRITSVIVVAGTSVPTATVVEPMRQVVRRLDPNLSVSGVTTMERRVSEAFQGDRFNLSLVGVFAMLAVAMAAVGIFAAMAYSIEERTQEFGVRLALGSGPRGILQLALGQSLRLGLAGIGLGVCAALVIGRLLGNALYMVPTEHEGVLYGVGVADPLTLACASIALMGSVLAAAFIPARRATRVDPIAALRNE